MKKSITFKRIDNEKELTSSLLFIGNGFKFSKKISNVIFDSLIKNNKKLGYYGFIMEDESLNIIGAILTIYQGEITIKDRKYSIINTSSWYVDKKHRGYKSILMAKYFTQALSDNIVTNLSSNNFASPVFEALGYKKADTCTTNYKIHQYIYHSLSSKKWHSEVIECSQSNTYKHNNLCLRDSIYVSLRISNRSLILLVTKSKACEKIMNFRICLTRVNIVWSSNSELLREKYFSIMGFLLFKFKAPIVSCHCLKIKERIIERIWRYHYYYSKENIKSELPIIGSEYSIGL